METLDENDEPSAVMNDFRKDILAQLIPLRKDQRDTVEIEPPFQVYVFIGLGTDMH